jgi:membrane protease YdiL (CAAX protease family)
MTSARLVLLVLPLVLIPTMVWVFRACVSRLQLRRGYFGAFCIYWFIGCLFVPWATLGSDIFRSFRATPRPFGSSAALGILALTAPLALGFGYAFPKAIRGSDRVVVLLSAVVAAVNAPLEELLWRGAYLTAFPDEWLSGFVYPSIGFALWHIAPLSVVPNRAPGGTWSFIVVSGLVGGMWGWVAMTTGSILWTTVAHVLFDFSGLGARIYVRPAALPRLT